MGFHTHRGVLRICLFGERGLLRELTDLVGEG